MTLPVLGDIFNFDPDVHMQTGGARVGLVDDAVGPPAASPLVAVSHPTASSTRPSTGQPSGAGSPAATPGTSASPGVADAAGFPAGLIAGPVKGSLVTSGALGPASWGRPPSGSGRTMTVHLPAPWTGGKSSTATVEIYLPPGYDKGNTRYPVFYEAPSTLGSWQNGMAFTTAMDGLMTSGYMPPAIVVFASTAGGPYVDAECADTFDGKEWFNRYMATDVVKWVDFEPSHDRDAGRSEHPWLLAGRLLLGRDHGPPSQRLQHVGLDERLFPGRHQVGHDADGLATLRQRSAADVGIVTDRTRAGAAGLAAGAT